MKKFGQKKASNSWPIPRLVDEAILQDPSLQRLVKVSSYLTPNLSVSGPIHNVFSRRNFSNITANAFYNLRLGFRLATLLMRSENLLDWWVHAAYGTPVKFNSKRDLLEKMTEYTEDHRQMTREAIDSLAPLVVWQFKPYDGDGFSYARTSERKLERKVPLHPLFANARPGHGCLVQIEPQFRDFAENGFDEASLEDQLRFLFLFAATVVHELTHCFGIMRRGTICEEFINSHDPEAELGFSWEEHAFGGPILTSNGCLGPPGPLVWNTWADHHAKSSTEKKKEFEFLRILVPIDWIAGWFRSEFWLGQEDMRHPQETLQFWESSEKRVRLLKDSDNAVRKRPFMVFEEIQEQEERPTVHRSKRRCHRTS